MNERMTLSQFLKLLRADRSRWESALARVDRERMEEPALPGGWTIKGLVGHVSWFEREIVGLLETRSLAGSSPWWALDTDERNQRIYEETQARPLDEVLDEAAAVYPSLLRLIKALDEDALNHPARFAEMPNDWIPWRILAENTFEHYRDHAEEVETWLAKSRG